MRLHCAHFHAELFLYNLSVSDAAAAVGFASLFGGWHKYCDKVKQTTSHSFLLCRLWRRKSLVRRIRVDKFADATALHATVSEIALQSLCLAT